MKKLRAPSRSILDLLKFFAWVTLALVSAPTQTLATDPHCTTLTQERRRQLEQDLEDRLEYVRHQLVEDQNPGPSTPPRPTSTLVFRSEDPRNTLPPRAIERLIANATLLPAPGTGPTPQGPALFPDSSGSRFFVFDGTHWYHIERREVGTGLNRQIIYAVLTRGTTQPIDLATTLGLHPDIIQERIQRTQASAATSTETAPARETTTRAQPPSSPPSRPESAPPAPTSVGPVPLAPTRPLAPAQLQRLLRHLTEGRLTLGTTPISGCHTVYAVNQAFRAESRNPNYASHTLERLTLINPRAIRIPLSGGSLQELYIYIIDIGALRGNMQKTVFSPVPLLVAADGKSLIADPTSSTRLSESPSPSFTAAVETIAVSTWQEVARQLSLPAERQAAIDNEQRLRVTVSLPGGDTIQMAAFLQMGIEPLPPPTAGVVAITPEQSELSTIFPIVPRRR
jgi:hypothetical protein